jgi:hypothetical protein
VVRPSGFEPPTFCSGGSRSDYESIAYINHRHYPTLAFLNNSALSVANWWGRHRSPIQALTRVATSCVVASESQSHRAGGAR